MRRSRPSYLSILSSRLTCRDPFFQCLRPRFEVISPIAQNIIVKLPFSHINISNSYMVDRVCLHCITILLYILRRVGFTSKKPAEHWSKIS